MGRPQRPLGLDLIAFLLLLLGGLALVGEAIYLRENQFGAYMVFEATGSLAMVATAILIFTNQRSAVQWSLLCAALLTVSRVHDDAPAIRTLGMSLHGILLIGRTLFNIALYWVAFRWFKKWRARVDSSGQTQTDHGWWPSKPEP